MLNNFRGDVTDISAIKKKTADGGRSVFYLNDVSIHSKALEKDKDHLNNVLAALHKHHYSCSPK